MRHTRSMGLALREDYLFHLADFPGYFSLQIKRHWESQCVVVGFAKRVDGTFRTCDLSMERLWCLGYAWAPLRCFCFLFLP
jgi:hypothetical protein